MIGHGFEPGLGGTPWDDELDDLGYMGRRLAQTHDFWHVLGGYNGDPVGELGFVAFNVGQTGTPGFVYILAHVIGRSVSDRWRNEHRLGSPLVGYLWRAYRAGRRARFLPPLRLEAYFDRPLDEVRRQLRIEPLRATLPGALPPVAV